MALCGPWGQFRSQCEEFCSALLRQKSSVIGFSAPKNIQTRDTPNSSFCRSFVINPLPSLEKFLQA